MTSEREPFQGSPRKHGGPTHSLTEDVAALIRQSDPHTAAKQAIQRVEAAVESKFRLGYDAALLQLQQLVSAHQQDASRPVAEVLADAVEFLEAS